MNGPPTNDQTGCGHSRPRRASPGTLNTTGSPCVYDHGQHACYTLDRCRCGRCREANRAYEAERSRRVTPSFVDATPAREHVAWLATQGVGLKQIARRTGVSHGSLSKLVYGQHGHPPSRRIRPDTMARLLAITLTDRAAGARVPAGPTWTQVDQMVAAGVPKVRIAEWIGQAGPGLQLGRKQVTEAHARAVQALYDRFAAGELAVARRHRHGDVMLRFPALPPAERIACPVAIAVDTRRRRPKVVQHLPEGVLRPTSRRRGGFATAGEVAAFVATLADTSSPAVAVARHFEVSVRAAASRLTEARKAGFAIPMGKPVNEGESVRSMAGLPVVSLPTSPMDGGGAAAWRRRAACRGTPGWLWFPTDRDAATTAKAKAVCRGCPVRTECLEAHLAEPHGVFGGLDELERAALRARSVVAPATTSEAFAEKIRPTGR